jgi:thiamine-phosphate pyrophosphorylase
MTLAELARCLNLRGLRSRAATSRIRSLHTRPRARKWGRRLPSLILVTDSERLPEPLSAVLGLPPGSAVILRDPDPKRRRRLARALSRACRARRVLLIVADDAALAHHVRADGLHLSERRVATPVVRGGGWRYRRPRWIVTGAAHSERALMTAARRGLDAALLSPVFETASHPGGRPLGPRRFAAASLASPIPVYALGGVTEATARGLFRSGAIGIAALGALAPKRKRRTRRLEAPGAF